MKKGERKIEGKKAWSFGKREAEHKAERKASYVPYSIFMFMSLQKKPIKPS